MRWQRVYGKVQALSLRFSTIRLPLLFWSLALSVSHLLSLCCFLYVLWRAEVINSPWSVTVGVRERGCLRVSEACRSGTLFEKFKSFQTSCNLTPVTFLHTRTYTHFNKSQMLPNYLYPVHSLKGIFHQKDNINNKICHHLLTLLLF